MSFPSWMWLLPPTMAILIAYVIYRVISHSVQVETLRPAVVAVTGPNASGKSSVCTFFAERGFLHVSLSDILRAECAKRHGNRQPSRQELVDMGNHIRAQKGPGALAAMLAKTLRKDRDYVIDSIRHPEEVAALRDSHKHKTLVVATNATLETRWLRLQKRKRARDCATIEDFRKIDQLEMENPDPRGQQIQATMDAADVVLHNDTTEEDLRKQLPAIWSIVKPNSARAQASAQAEAEDLAATYARDLFPQEEEEQEANGAARLALLSNCRDGTWPPTVMGSQHQRHGRWGVPNASSDGRQSQTLTQRRPPVKERIASSLN